MKKKKLIVVLIISIILTVGLSCKNSKDKSKNSKDVERKLKGSEITFSGDERYDVVYKRKKDEINEIHNKLDKFNLYADDVGEFYDYYQKLEEVSDFIIEYLTAKSDVKGGDKDLYIIADSYDIVGRSHFDTNKDIAEAYILLIRMYPESKYVSNAEQWLKDRNISY